MLSGTRSLVPSSPDVSNRQGGLAMSDTVQLITAFSGLTVAVGALIISIGVLYLVMKLGDAIGSQADDD